MGETCSTNEGEEELLYVVGGNAGRKEGGH
jgi:hypothetical protein